MVFKVRRAALVLQVVNHITILGMTHYIYILSLNKKQGRKRILFKVCFLIWFRMLSQMKG